MYRFIIVSLKLLSVILLLNVFPLSLALDSLSLSSQRYNLCGRYACPAEGKFAFQASTQYVYTYSLNVTSSFDKNGTSASRMDFKFRIEIKIKQCEGIMRVKSYDKSDFGFFEEENDVDKLYAEVSEYNLRFSFYDGSIFTVCPHKDETILSLNIKKGILTAFQNKMKRFDVDTLVSERDVNGLCPTYYNLERVSGTTLVIRKVKDIAGCLERYQLHSILPTSRFVFQMKYHKWAPLNSSVICHQTIDHGIPINIQCKEEHILKLFESQNHTSNTVLSQELNLISETSAFQTLFNSLHSSEEISIWDDLSFNHRKPKKSEVSELEESRNLLRQLCDVASNEFQLDAATVFSKFIHTTRRLSYDALKMLYQESQESIICPSATKHLQDSLPFLRSTSSISLMKDIIKAGNVSSSTTNGWLFATALFTRPDESVINSVTDLLYDGEASDTVLLSISTVLHSYCTWSNVECSGQEDIISVISHLERLLNATIEENNLNKAIVILKALGNSGVVTPTIKYTLASCIKSYNSPIAVKLTAIEAYRRLPCDYEVKFLQDIYTNMIFDSELRIAAYLQLMRCPHYSTIKKIKQTLQDESVNQVGSFVWSHLKNTMKSSMITLVDVQSILQDYNLKNKFNLDFRKFSRNYEISFYIADYGLGGFISSNVIFSPKSYIPRSISTNITVTIFGETINIVEMQVYLEGFERYPEKMFKGGTNFVEDFIEKQFNASRFIRSVSSSIKDAINQLPNVVRDNFPEPQISFAGKIFGNELFYRNYKGDDEIRKAVNQFNPYVIMKEFFNGQEIKYDYAAVFMDISYVTPTSAGVPLNLDAVGIGITNFHKHMLVDADNFFQTGKITISGKLKPRFSINFEGIMGAELVYKQTEIKLRNKLFTSSAVEGKFLMDTYDNISISFDLPLSKFDILNMETDLIYKDNKEQNDKFSGSADVSLFTGENVCFWPLVNQFLGLKVCSTYALPDAEQLIRSPLFIFREPFKFALFLEKSDSSAKTYVFRYRRVQLENKNWIIYFEFETPDSDIRRSMKSVTYAVNKNYNFTLEIHANETIVDAFGLYRNTKDEKALNFTLDINKVRHIDFLLQLQITQDKKAFIYYPKMFFAVTSKPVAELTGMYKWVEKKGVKQCDIDLRFKTNRFDSDITGYIKLEDHLFATNIHTNYRFINGTDESLKFELKYADHSTKLNTDVQCNLQLESTAYTQMNFTTVVKYQKSQDHFNMKIEYISNPYLEDDRQKLFFQLAFMYLKSFNGMKLSTFVEIKKQISDVNIKLSLAHRNNPSGSTSTLLIRYATDRDIIVRLDILKPQTILLHYEIKLNVTLPAVQQPMIVSLRIMEQDEHEYDLDFSGTWFSGHSATARGTFQDKSNHYISTYILKLQVKSRLFNEILFLGKLSYNENEYKVSATADHNNIKYSILIKHVIDNEEQYETYVEYIYNQTIVYSINNHLSFPNKELIAELHLDKHRDVYIALRGALKRWVTNFGVEIKWDVNRDPSQKLLFNVRTWSEPISNDGILYSAKSIFEYPGHISMASFAVQCREDKKYRISVSLEMNPSSIIEAVGFVQNDVFNSGVGEVGLKLLTPFDNWKETSFSAGIYIGRQNYQTNGSLVWQGNHTIMFDSHGGYTLDENVTAVLISSSLNSSLNELSALGFKISYRNIINEYQIELLMQPNPKYLIFASTSGSRKYFDNGVEYVVTLATKTPFLEYKETDLKVRLKLLTENRLNGDFSFYLNQKPYIVFFKGVLKPFDDSHLCMKIITPYEQYKLVDGKFIYAPDDKRFYLNFKGQSVDLGVDLIYVYNNITDFNLKLHLLTPLSYFNKLLLTAMYNGKSLQLMGGWNSVLVGFSGVSFFGSWANLNYAVKLYTPIEAFKECSAELKILIQEEITVKAHFTLSKTGKAGIIFEYDTDKSKVVHPDECVDLTKFSSDYDDRIILKNGLLILDTLLYPTISAMFLVTNSNENYVLESKLELLHLTLSLVDTLDYHNFMSFKNKLLLETSIDMFSKIVTNLKVNHTLSRVINSTFDIELTSFNKIIQGGTDVNFEYIHIHADPNGVKNKIFQNGIYKLDIKMYTPFKLIETCKVFVDFYVKNDNYITSVHVLTNYTDLLITSDLKLYNDYFDVIAGINATSVYLAIPVMKIEVKRDFSNLEKEILVTFKILDNIEGMIDVFFLKSVWYIDSKNFIHLIGELKTPFRVLDHLQGTLYYSHEFNSENYCLECYVKYSNKTELKARAELYPPTVWLNLESSLEGFRSAHFNGTVRKINNEKQVIEAVMVTNSSFRIEGWSSTTDNVPFALEGKLVNGPEHSAISSVNMHLKKTKWGYNVLAELNSNNKSLHVETEITDNPDKTRIINLQITSSYWNNELLSVNGKLILRHPGTYIFIVSGNSLIEGVKSNLTSEIKIWFKNGIAAVFATLDSSLVRGSSEIFGIWEPPNTMFGQLRISYLAKQIPTDVVFSKIYLMKSNDTSNMTTGLRISLNEKWALEGNLTTVIPSWDNASFESNLYLPNEEQRSMHGKLYFNYNMDIFEHLLIYTFSQLSPCYTVSDLKWKDNNVGGVAAFKCGIKNPIYMIDKVNGHRNEKGIFYGENTLKSNTLKNTLLQKITYHKPNDYHNLLVKLYYPASTLITSTDIQMKSVNNFKCELNTYNLFTAIPNLKSDIIAVTDLNTYSRYGKVYFHEKSAFFNLTHTRKRKNADVILNDGHVTVLFPITTVHEGSLAYRYEDRHGNVKGSSNISYNNETIIIGNFSRNVVITKIKDSSDIHLDIENKFVPLGITYLHQCSTPAIVPIFDLKRIEIFKLRNDQSNPVNFTGELWSQTQGNKDWSYIKIFSSNRSIELDSHRDGNKLSKSDFSLKLKPEIWFNSGLILSKKIANNVPRKIMDLSISYPRRNFSIVGEFSYVDNQLQADLVVYNYLVTPTKAVGVQFIYNKLGYNFRKAYILLFHPSFEKNITLNASFFNSELILMDAKVGLEYANDEDKNLMVICSIEDKNPKTGRNYSLYLDGKHAATKFKLNIDGILISKYSSHLLRNNISYRRAYLPDHYWNGRLLLNTKENIFEIEKASLMGTTFIHGDYQTHQTLQQVNAIILKDPDTNITSELDFDWYNKEMYFIVNLTADGTDKFQMESNVPENREIKLNIWRMFNNVIFPQVSLYGALNNSRLLTSALLWRTDISTNILRGIQSSVQYLWSSSQDSIEFWTQFVRSEASDTVNDIWLDIKPNVHDLLDDINNLKTIQDNINYFKSVFNNSYNTNEFFLRDIHEMYLLLTEDISFGDKFGSFPKIVNEIWESMGETGKVIRISLIKFIDTIKDIYQRLMIQLDELVEKGTEVHISKFIQNLTNKFDTFIKDLHISFISSAEKAIHELMIVLTNYWNQLVQVLEPTFIEIIHYLESTAWSGSKKLLDFIYARKEELMNSPYFLRSASFTHQLDLLYKDLTKNDIMTNVKKYFTLLFNAVYEYYYENMPFRQELMDIGNEILGEVQQLYNLPLIAYTVDNIKLMYNQTIWLYNYLDVNNVLQKAIPYIYKKVVENSYSALENEMKVHKAKTKFYFEPEIGVIRMEQKLPFPWHAFNETPIYEEISEYKTLRQYRNYLSPSTSTFWYYYHRLIVFLSPSTWFPPFDGYALIVGSRNIITFDRQRVEFDESKCIYLLSYDFIGHSFTITLENKVVDFQPSQVVSIIVDDDVVSIDLARKLVEVNSNTSYHVLPAQLNSTSVYYENEMIMVINEKGIKLECNLHYQLCKVRVPGWYFGKVSGLFGTLNNEPNDDVLILNNRSGPAATWLINNEEQRNVQKLPSTASKPPADLQQLCTGLFVNKSSEFENCFQELDPAPYFEMCMSSSTYEEMCTFAVAYVQVCFSLYTPLRIPSLCIKCSFNKPNDMEDGLFVHIDKGQVPLSTDIVFIVEAKECNRNIFTKKNITLLISTISKELENQRVFKNRYSLVVFGATNSIRSVAVDNTVFANSTVFPNYFKYFLTGNGSSDIFSALRFATKMHFRPGVSKTFILIPCSSCDPSKQTLDYSVLHHVMMEKSISLHILMESDFTLDKLKSQKFPFGIDSVTAYTRNDYQTMKGDLELRKNIKLTKFVLGYCIPLSIESNGSVFTLRRLETDNVNLAKKFLTVFAKRIARSANSVPCQNCECSSDSNGIPFIDCTSCVYPTPINFNFDSDESDLQTMLNFTSLTADSA